MSAQSDAQNIGALSNTLHNLLHASPVDIPACQRAHAKLCLALTSGLNAYASTLGISSGDIPSIIQGGGTPKTEPE
jgi:hypothetical protein